MGDEKENDIIKLLKTIDNYYDKLIGEDITKDKTYENYENENHQTLIILEGFSQNGL